MTSRADDLETAVERLTLAIGALRTEIRRRTAAVGLLLAVVLIVGYLVAHDYDRRISANTRRLATVTYRQCQTIDTTNRRQIALINSAIEAERRKPAPDAKRISDLEKFRPDRVDCGTAPR